MQFGLACTETTEGLQKMQCLFFNVVISNASFITSKLKHHFNNQHSGADVSGHDV